MYQKLRSLFYLLLLINVLYVLSGVFHFSLQSVDVIGIWLFKAKAFYIEGGIPFQTLKNPDFILFHPQYPLLLPLVYSLIYFILGKVWELPILLLYPGYYVAILWLVNMVLRRLGCNRLQALVYVYIYSMFSPFLGQAGRMHAGSADIVIVLVAWVLIAILQESSRRGVVKTAALVTVITMIASQIKFEGLFLGAALVVLPMSWPKKMWWLIVAGVPFLVWAGLRVVWQIPSDFTFVIHSPGELLSRIWLIFSLSLREMANLRNWYVFWPLFWGGLYFSVEKISFFLRQLLLVGGMVSLGFVLVYLSVTTDVYAHIDSSIDRVLFQILPYLYPVFVMSSLSVLRLVAERFGFVLPEPKK